MFKTKFYNPKTRGGIKRQGFRNCIQDKISNLTITFFHYLCLTSSVLKRIPVARRERVA